jgi:endonuclease G
MNIDPLEIARARAALHQAVGNFLFDRVRKINLIDIALFEGEGHSKSWLAIRFHVDKQIPGPQLEAVGREPLQRMSILDIPTMVVEGRYRPHQWSGWGGWGPTYNPRVNRADPLRGGISISSSSYGSGTLGGLVRDRNTGKAMVLSNWHVLSVYWGAPRGQPILQPGWNDGGTSADVIAALDRDAMSDNLDAAVALITANRQLTNEQLDIGSVTGVGRPSLDMEVVKSGRTSGRTYGRITGVGGMLRLQYGWLERLVRDVITIEPRQGPEVSRGGDSGSWWLNNATKQAIGLHFAGSDYPERALALDMRAVLNSLNVDILT